MVHIGTKTAFAAGRRHRHRHDEMVREGFDGKTDRCAIEGTQGGPVGADRVSRHHAERQARVAGVLGFGHADHDQGFIDRAEVAGAVAAEPDE